MVGTSSNDPRWPREILGFGHHGMPDTRRGLQAADAPDSRVDAEYCETHEAGSSGAGFFDLVASCAGG